VERKENTPLYCGVFLFAGEGESVVVTTLQGCILSIGLFVWGCNSDFLSNAFENRQDLPDITREDVSTLL